MATLTSLRMGPMSWLSGGVCESPTPNSADIPGIPMGERGVEEAAVLDVPGESELFPSHPVVGVPSSTPP